MPHEFDKLRLAYELGNQTIPEMCAEHGYIIKEVEGYAAANGWKQIPQPNPNAPEEVEQYYRRARARLTVALSAKALSVYQKLSDIEQSILTQLTAQLTAINGPDVNLLEDNSLTLARLTKVAAQLQANNALFLEAISTPAMAEKGPQSTSLPGDDDGTWEVTVVRKTDVEDRADQEPVAKPIENSDAEV